MACPTPSSTARSSTSRARRLLPDPAGPSRSTRWGRRSTSAARTPAQSALRSSRRPSTGSSRSPKRPYAPAAGRASPSSSSKSSSRRLENSVARNRRGVVGNEEGASMLSETTVSSISRGSGARLTPTWVACLPGTVRAVTGRISRRVSSTSAAQEGRSRACTSSSQLHSSTKACGTSLVRGTSSGAFTPRRITAACTGSASGNGLFPAQSS